MDVSVVIAARNAAETIGSQVTAVLTQACNRSWELIVVDDASTDQTARAADEAAGQAGRYRRLTVTAPLGASGARRAGVDVALGALLVFCDADDVVQRGWLQALTEGSETDDAVGGYCDDTLLNPARLRRRRPAQPIDGLPVGVGGVRYGLGANLAVRRDVYDAVGGWDPTIAHGTDLDLCLRLQAAGFSLGWTPDAVVAYRHRPRRWALVVQSYRWGEADALLARRHASYLADRPESARVRAALGRLLSGQDSVLRLGSFATGRVVGLRR